LLGGLKKSWVVTEDDAVVWKRPPTVGTVLIMNDASALAWSAPYVALPYASMAVVTAPPFTVPENPVPQDTDVAVTAGTQAALLALPPTRYVMPLP
jgi:hypothetical protein